MQASRSVFWGDLSEGCPTVHRAAHRVHRAAHRVHRGAHRVHIGYIGLPISAFPKKGKLSGKNAPFDFWEGLLLLFIFFKKCEKLEIK